MKTSLKEFIKQSNKIIKRENLKINNWHQNISEYETIMDVISKTANNEILDFYKEKINCCYNRIENSLDKIKHNEEIIATIRTVDRIIKRGDRVA